MPMRCQKERFESMYIVVTANKILNFYSYHNSKQHPMFVFSER
jgi:hypothetical protein